MIIILTSSLVFFGFHYDLIIILLIQTFYRRILKFNYSM